MFHIEGKPQPDGTFSEGTQWIGIQKKNDDGTKKGIKIGNYIVRVSITEAKNNNFPQKEDIFSSEEA